MNYEDFQYDSCVSKGVCSVSPQTAALQTVLLMYLKFVSKYALNLYNKKIIDKNLEYLILTTITIAVSNPEFTETSFSSIVSLFKEKLPKIIEKYNKACSQNDFEKNDLGSLELFLKTENITESIRYGELEFRKISKRIDFETLNLCRIALVVAKSISINLMDLESFDKSSEKSFLFILKILDIISKDDIDKDELENLIIKMSKIDMDLSFKLRKAQEERYGIQTVSEVSYSTTPSKAVLVVGSNIRELETVLESLKDTKIEVYTHDEMMLAHTFSKFKEYKNLKGQYGQGVENCLLDFATFPGPIILTKHSLHNIESLYRGRLFTTDYTCPKGVIRIENNDFSEVIKAANNSKGFKRGRECETVTIGYDYEKIITKIQETLANSKYKSLCYIGLERYSSEQNDYFEKLIKLAPKSMLIISYSNFVEQENYIHINTCFDQFSLIKIYERLKEQNLPTFVFMPKCDRNTISQMIYLAQNENTKVFVGKCTPIILNPSLILTLQKIFKIKEITSAKNDIAE
jgi:hydroxylamine reductase